MVQFGLMLLCDPVTVQVFPIRRCAVPATAGHAHGQAVKLATGHVRHEINLFAVEDSPDRLPEEHSLQEDTRVAGENQSTCALYFLDSRATLLPDTERGGAMTTKEQKAFQDYYPDDVSHCYGCGRLNGHGHQIKSTWDGDESVTIFVPKPYHIAIPGYVYGGLIASLIDCHGTGTAAAAMYRVEGREMDSDPPYRFVTASLKVDYLRPTPLGVPLEIRGRVKEISGRKVIVAATLSAGGTVCARGEIVAVQMPEGMLPGQS